MLQGSFPQGRPPSAHAFAAQAELRGDSFVLPPSVDVTSRAPGMPLPPAVLQEMESLFQARFADVRVHVGAQAMSIGAAAFTSGTEIYFAPGRYNPGTVQGRQLLAHELTHVVQQRAGRARNPFGRGVAVVHDPVLEAEAQRMGQRVGLAQQVPPRPVQRSTAAVQPRLATAGPAQHVQAAFQRHPSAREHPGGPATRLSPPVVQCADEEKKVSKINMKVIVNEAHNARHLPSRYLEHYAQTVRRALSAISLMDPRRRTLENAYHAFSSALSFREARKESLVTRIIRPDQLVRENMGIRSVRFSKSLPRNIGTSLKPFRPKKKIRKLSHRMQSLYAFMRTFGKGGIQGFHRDPSDRIRAIHRLLGKIGQDVDRQSPRGPKFAVVAIDPSRLQQENVMDLSRPEIEQEFSELYGPQGTNSKKNFMGMYGTHKQEGVVAVREDIPLEAIMGLRAFRGVPPTEEELEEIYQHLLELAADRAEGVDEDELRKYKRQDEDDRDPPPMTGEMMSF